MADAPVEDDLGVNGSSYEGLVNDSKEAAYELHDALLGLTWLHEETWLNEITTFASTNYDKLREVLVRHVDPEVVRRLFVRATRAEALADRELCAEVAAKLRKAVEGKPRYCAPVRWYAEDA